jgi:hypothetical protein
MSSIPSSLYFSNIQEKSDIDIITLEELDHSHPRSIITLYNGYNPATQKDNEISSFNTKSIYEMILHNKMFNPLTREFFDDNQIKRIKWYKKCLDDYPSISLEDISDYKTIITNWLISPLVTNDFSEKAKYFITYDQIIDFFGFKDIDTREKAEQFFIDNPDKQWVIRKSSVADTIYNQFFVIMTKNESFYNNYLYVHRQGYGLTRANTYRYSNISKVELIKFDYYTNIVDLLISLCKNNIISL